MSDGSNPRPSEFAKFLLNITRTRGIQSLPIHFMPQANLCPWCLMPFDMVGNTDSMTEDLEKLANEYLHMEVMYCLKK